MIGTSGRSLGWTPSRMLTMVLGDHADPFKVLATRLREGGRDAIGGACWRRRSFR
jgi:hypothetical protein